MAYNLSKLKILNYVFFSLSNYSLKMFLISDDKCVDNIIKVLKILIVEKWLMLISFFIPRIKW